MNFVELAYARTTEDGVDRDYEGVCEGTQVKEMDSFVIECGNGDVHSRYGYKTTATIATGLDSVVANFQILSMSRSLCTGGTL